MKKPSKDTIFALSTCFGQSAIAVLRISGNNCKKIAKKLCKIKNIKNRYAHYSSIFDHNSNLIDKGVVIFFKSPKSFTGEDLLEIHTHGSIAIIKKLITVLSEIPNTRIAKPGEFSKRAYYNDKGEILFFEGINNLIKSETESQRIIANKQIYGSNNQNCIIWKDKILETLAMIDAEIEFGEEVEELHPNIIKKNIRIIYKQIHRASVSCDFNRNLFHGSKVLIVGPTNAGKSSFFNFLLQEDKMIVSETKGTTTDQSEQTIEIFGKKVTIIDTAGIRDSKNKIEKIGVEKTLNSIRTNDKIIVVLSPDSIETKNIERIKKVFQILDSKNGVVIFNKSDLYNSESKFNDWKRKIPIIKNFRSVTISCKIDLSNNKILNKCYKLIDKNLLSIDTINDDYYFSELRHVECLNSVLRNLDYAIENLSSFEISSKYLRDALSYLENLYGSHNEDDKLEIIFNKFCIGK